MSWPIVGLVGVFFLFLFYYSSPNIISKPIELSSFLDLNDTPNSYAGNAGKVPTVNAGENALVFLDVNGGGGLGDTNQVKVSANDTTPNYLESKLVGGQNVDVNVLNEGGNEQLQINVDLNGFGGGGGTGRTYTSGTPATIQVNNDANTISQNFDGNFWSRASTLFPVPDANISSASNWNSKVSWSQINAVVPWQDVNVSDTITVSNYVTNNVFNASFPINWDNNVSNKPYIPTEANIDANALGVINGLDLNNSLSYLKTDTNCSTSADCNSMYIQKNPLNDQNINNYDLNIYNGQLVLQAGTNIGNSNNNIFEVWNQNGVKTIRIDQNGNVFNDGNFTCIDANCFIGGTSQAIGRRHFYNGYQYTANALTGGGNLWISANTYAFAVTGTATSGLYFDASAPRGFKYRIDGTDRFTVGAGSTNVDGSVWQTIRYADTIGQPDGTWSFRDLGFIDMNWQPYIRRNGVENHINAQVYLGTPINTTYATVLSGDGAYPLTETDANWIGDMNMKGDMYFDANRFMIKSGKNVDSNVVLNLPSSTSAGMDVYADTSTEQLYYNTSDASMKTNIQDINQYIDYNKLNQLQPKCWNDIHNGKKGCGFIAQDVQTIFPQAVYTLPNGLLSIHYDYFNILLVEAIQKQMQINATTKAKLNQAEAFITAYCTTGGHSATPECQAVLNP